MKFPPHLDHLRRDRRNIPVPYVNRYGLEEETARVSIRDDPHVGRPGLFWDETGLDVPDFRHQCFQRQREAMIEGLCQVCGYPVPWSRRFLIFSDMSSEVVKVDGRRVRVIIEPWLCGRCCDTAVSACPALIRRTREEELVVLPVTSKRQVTLIQSRGWIEGPLETESRKVQPTMWVKLAVTGT